MRSDKVKAADLISSLRAVLASLVAILRGLRWSEGEVELFEVYVGMETREPQR